MTLSDAMIVGAIRLSEGVDRFEVVLDHFWTNARIQLQSEFPA